LQNGAGKAVLTTEKKSRHILEKIGVTDECQVPEFEIRQQLKEQTITISELQLLQIAPSIRQQLSRLMQCRRRAKTTKTKEAPVNMLALFRELLDLIGFKGHQP
jgi:hypothetical protein